MDRLVLFSKTGRKKSSVQLLFTLYRWSPFYDTHYKIEVNAGLTYYISHSAR